MIACFLSNISAKYYKNPSMLSRVIAKNVGDVFFETQCIYRCYYIGLHGLPHSSRRGRMELGGEDNDGLSQQVSAETT